jgi:hypothetical protein
MPNLGTGSANTNTHVQTRTYQFVYHVFCSYKFNHQHTWFGLASPVILVRDSWVGCVVAFVPPTLKAAETSILKQCLRNNHN